MPTHLHTFSNFPNVTDIKPVLSVSDSIFCHSQSVSVTVNLCLSQTVSVCNRQSVSVTDSPSLSQTICVRHRHTVSVTGSL